MSLSGNCSREIWSSAFHVAEKTGYSTEVIVANRVIIMLQRVHKYILRTLFLQLVAFATRQSGPGP
jgi:hypothetical protein